jgi:quercetin dioxygenase-like cupin family protein
LGREGEQLSCGEVVKHLRHLRAATDLPVNVDFAAGFANDIGKALDTIMTTDTGPDAILNENIFEIASSLHTEEHGTGGRISRVLIDLPDLRVQLISLTAGAHVPEHKVEGAITVQPVLGRVQMSAFGIGSEATESPRIQQQYELGVGSLLSLKGGVPHDVRALEDSCILVSIVRAKH